VRGTLVTLPGPSRLVRPVAFLSLAAVLVAFRLLATASAFGADDYASKAPNSVTLAVSVAGEGSGTITSDPVGIDCASTCSAQFPSGTVVTLTAAASPGAVFDHWTGACSGTDRVCSLTLSRRMSATAVFARIATPPPPTPADTPGPTATPIASAGVTRPPGSGGGPGPTQPRTGGSQPSTAPAQSGLPAESGPPTETPATSPLDTSGLTQPSGSGPAATPAPLTAGLGAPEFTTLVAVAAILTAAIVSIGIAVLAVAESRARQERRRPPPET
jgi:Divergent InlB B-repeat domain